MRNKAVIGDISPRAPFESDPADVPAERLDWHCRWTRVDGATRRRSTLVWICEFPYRTMMAEPPEPGACAGCPLHDEHLALRSAARPAA